MLRALLRAANAAAEGHGPDLSVRDDLLRLEIGGGWRGGDARLRAVRGSHRYEAAILNGRARLWLDGAEAAPAEIVYAPWGFRMMVGSLLDGVSYAVGLRPPEGPQRLSVMSYGPGLMQFGPRELIPAEGASL
jgi:hypothetical protein